jgi:hypothetical protein
MLNIQYFKCDATKPIGNGEKYICHVCNDIGAWGAGFVLALSKKWTEPELSYKARFFFNKKPELGTFNIAQVEKDVFVVNMIAQHGVGLNGKPPIRYDAVEKCLGDLANEILTSETWIRGHEVSVHMPRIGCGLAGGKWDVIEKIIIDKLSKQDIPVFVYDLG